MDDANQYTMIFSYRDANGNRLIVWKTAPQLQEHVVRGGHFVISFTKDNLFEQLREQFRNRIDDDTLSDLEDFLESMLNVKMASEQVLYLSMVLQLHVKEDHFQMLDLYQTASAFLMTDRKEDVSYQ